MSARRIGVCSESGGSHQSVKHPPSVGKHSPGVLESNGRSQKEVYKTEASKLYLSHLGMGCT